MRRWAALVALAVLGAALWAWWASRGEVPALPDSSAPAAASDSPPPPPLRPAPRIAAIDEAAAPVPTAPSPTVPAASARAWRPVGDAGAAAPLLGSLALCLDEHLEHGARVELSLRVARTPSGALQRSANTTAQSPYLQACLEDLLDDEGARGVGPLSLTVAFERAGGVQVGPDGGGL